MAIGAGNSERKRLRNVVGVHMVHGLQSEVGQVECLPLGKTLPRTKREVALWVDDRPAGPGNMTGTKAGASQSVRPLALHPKHFLDCGLADAVVAPRFARVVFVGGNGFERTLDPDRGAHDEVLHSAPQRVDKLPLRTRD